MIPTITALLLANVLLVAGEGPSKSEHKSRGSVVPHITAPDVAHTPIEKERKRLQAYEKALDNIKADLLRREKRILLQEAELKFKFLWLTFEFEQQREGMSSVIIKPRTRTPEEQAQIDAVNKIKK